MTPRASNCSKTPTFRRAYAAIPAHSLTRCALRSSSTGSRIPPNYLPMFVRLSTQARAEWGNGCSRAPSCCRQLVRANDKSLWRGIHSGTSGAPGAEFRMIEPYCSVLPQQVREPINVPGVQLAAQPSGLPARSVLLPSA